ncbi:predicted protein [Thalassiosira pseudonana CCMP1335]|uniref:Uncharacterized protein n=1 Tax=Thalassiosira pseudonana TaxID=35128 RepID=B8BSN3_THAPS|nr:predicted protein [Thalassiosira pseudonana CCMP1335]EED96158.1 predicted protein [Thalassiosira pseudonana CCMP1335]|eukprot:scaffold15289_cov248-Alexandrium_tamarense.AAC.9
MSSPRPAKRVRFSENSLLILTESTFRNDFDESWYNRLELRQFKRDVKEATLAFRDVYSPSELDSIAYASANLTNTKAEEVRGLEQLISTNFLKLSIQKRRLATLHVLHEQAMQKEWGATPATDARRIAQVYHKYTEFSRAWSTQIATTRAA